MAYSCHHAGLLRPTIGIQADAEEVNKISTGGMECINEGKGTPLETWCVKGNARQRDKLPR